jgi:hypothetical protein
MPGSGIKSYMNVLRTCGLRNTLRNVPIYGNGVKFAGGLKFSGQFIIKLNIYEGLPPTSPPPNVQKVQCWNFRTTYGGQEPSRITVHRVIVPPARLLRLAESIPGNQFLGFLKV